MHEFPPNINWRYTTLLATFIGYLVCGDFTVKEQIAIGNWILQIGQTIMTNSTYQDMLEGRIIGREKINLNSRNFKCGGSPYINPSTSSDFTKFYEHLKSQISEEEFESLHKAILRINEELERFKEEIKNES